MSGRPASSSARARSSTCWGRCRTRPACGASWSACSRRNGWCRWPRCWAGSAPSAPGSCMATGIDEITTAGVTNGRRVQRRQGHELRGAPEDAGLPRAALDDLKGGEPAHNARADARPARRRARAVARHRAAQQRRGADRRRPRRRICATASTLAAQAIDSGAARARARPAGREDQRGGDCEAADERRPRPRSAPTSAPMSRARKAALPEAALRGRPRRRRRRAAFAAALERAARRGPLRPDRRDQEGARRAAA